MFLIVVCLFTRVFDVFHGVAYEQETCDLGLCCPWGGDAKARNTKDWSCNNLVRMTVCCSILLQASSIRSVIKSHLSKAIT